LLTVRPTEVYGGCVVAEPAPLPDPELFASTPRQPWKVRRAWEAAIVYRLAGPIAAELLGPLHSGPVAVDPCEVAAADLAEGLAALSPRSREVLAVREADPTPLVPDEHTAMAISLGLTGDVEEAAAHLSWLRVVSKRFVLERAYLIRLVAAELAVVGAMDGDMFRTLIASPKEATMRKPKPDEDGRYVMTASGIPVLLAAPLSLAHSHAKVATRTFLGGSGLVVEGSLRDDRSPVYAHHRDKFREPTAAERSGLAEANAKAATVAKAESRAKVAAADAKRAADEAKVATAALAAAKAGA
jgi:hypothetical protein